MVPAHTLEEAIRLVEWTLYLGTLQKKLAHLNSGDMPVEMTCYRLQPLVPAVGRPRSAERWTEYGVHCSLHYLLFRRWKVDWGTKNERSGPSTIVVSLSRDFGRQTLMSPDYSSEQGVPPTSLSPLKAREILFSTFRRISIFIANSNGFMTRGYLVSMLGTALTNLQDLNSLTAISFLPHLHSKQTTFMSQTTIARGYGKVFLWVIQASHAKPFKQGNGAGIQ